MFVNLKIKSVKVVVKKKNHINYDYKYSMDTLKNCGFIYKFTNLGATHIHSY